MQQPIIINLGGRERRLSIDLNSMIAIMELTGGDPLEITKTLTNQAAPLVERLKQMRLLLYAGLVSTDSEIAAMAPKDALMTVGSWIDGTDTLTAIAEPLMKAVQAYASKSAAGSREFDGQLAPYVPSPMPVVKAMVELANLQVNEAVCDLGCGDGRLLVACAETMPGTILIGYERHEGRATQAYEAVQRAGSHAMIRREDIREYRGDADVVFVYLLPNSNDEIRGMLVNRSKPGTRVISHDFAFSDWDAEKVVSVQCEDRIHKVYLYKL